jgi:hypothetical protein
VGSPLYKIDTEGYVAPVAGSAPPSSVKTAAAAATPAPAHSPALTANSRKHPTGHSSLIQFTGKRSLASHPPAKSSPVPSSAPVASKAPAAPPSQDNTHVWAPKDMAGYNAAWLGRPALSAAEIAAIESGGATIIN